MDSNKLNEDQHIDVEMIRGNRIISFRKPQNRGKQYKLGNPSKNTTADNSVKSVASREYRTMQLNHDDDDE